tara:strand:- start:262 stop:534 length:273 start_codon:yes stop_codon:yes gene_type:complete
LVGCTPDIVDDQDMNRSSYHKQTQELCENSGAEWTSFNSGCHDECFLERFDPKKAKKEGKIPIYVCTLALSTGCECGPDKCWNGTGCELN